MNEKLNKVSTNHLRTGLIIFCIIGGGFSLYLTIDAITARPKPIKVQSINIPRNIQQTEKWNNYQIDAELYEQIQRYKRWLDSTGEQISSGMRDSIRVIEELYNSQQNR